MKLNIVKTKNNTFYYLAESYRNGRKSSTRRIKSLGDYNQLIKSHSDPEAYCRQLVDHFNKERKSSILNYSEKIDFLEKLDPSTDIISSSTYKNIGYLYLNNLFNLLKLPGFFNQKTKTLKIKYSLTDAVKLLTFSRILSPTSKKSTFDNAQIYLNNFDLSLDDIYRSLDLIDEYSYDLQAHLYKQIDNIHPRKKNVLYYDCTNYYFEIENEDEKGLRKYGVSKEHRPNPIVQMGLFIDEDGIPLAFDISNGNTNEQTTAIPLEKRIIKDYSLSKFIYCSDAGLASERIKRFNSFNSRAYIVTKSLKKLPKEEQDLIFKDLNWKYLSNNKSASLAKYEEVADKYLNNQILSKEEEKIINGDLIYKEYCYKQERLIITFSLKSYIYQKMIFNKQINRASEKIKSNKLTYQAQDVRRLIEISGITSQGEVAEDIVLSLNKERIEVESRYHGFYCCATNLEEKAEEIIKINKARWKIEECFRVMKTSFKSRPVYLQKDNRIKAHFTICYLALIIFRMLKLNLNDKSITTDNILETLRNMNITIHDRLGYGKSLYTYSKTIEAIEKKYNLGLTHKYYSEAQLKRYKKK